MKHGLSADRIGPDGFSWTDVKAVFENLLPSESAYLRAKYPDEWFWADVPTRLAGKAATAMEKVAFLLAFQMFEKVPDEFGWNPYGPSDPESVTEEPSGPDDVDNARSIAAAMRG